MNSLYLPFSDLADHVISDATVRSRILAKAIALAIANTASLPTSPVDSVSTHYNQIVAPQAKQILSAFNENMVFDLNCAMECVRTFWLVRYTAAHPVAMPLYSDQYGFFDCMMGINRQVSEEMHEFLNAHKKAVLELAIAAYNIVGELLAPAAV